MKRLSKTERDSEDIKKWDKIVKKFSKGAIETGLSEIEAKNIADDLLKMSSYSFNLCFSGKSKITRDNTNKWSPTIEEMYKTKNDIKWAKDNNHSHTHEKYKYKGFGKAFSLNEEEKLIINDIINITYAGFRKTYKIVLENGSSLDVTSNHNFPVKIEGNIIYKNIDNDLKEGDSLFYNEGYEKTIKNQKGKKTSLQKIVSIEENEAENVYNVEMATPYHTLAVNNIVAKNSHASAYSYIAVMTLYLSYYFKKYFLAAELEYEINKGSNLADIFSSVRGQKFEILPPDVNKSLIDVTPLNEDKLILGLSNIKQVSKRAAEHIIDIRPVDSLFDLITKVDGRLLKIGGIKALVSVGAFDFENPNRKLMLQILTMFWEKKKSIKVVEKLKIKWQEAEGAVKQLPGIETSLVDLRNYEKEYFGGNFFASVFDDKMKDAFIEMRNKSLINFSFDEVTRISRKVPVVINNIRKIIDRNGNEMAFLNIEDVQGKAKSIPVFASYWKIIGNLLEEDEMYLMNMYQDNKGGILFGQNGWVDNPNKMRRMIKQL